MVEVEEFGAELRCFEWVRGHLVWAVAASSSRDGAICVEGGSGVAEAPSSLVAELVG